MSQLEKIVEPKSLCEFVAEVCEERKKRGYVPVEERLSQYLELLAASM